MRAMSIHPALTYRDVRAAIAWLEGAFGLQRHSVEEGGNDQVDHATVKHGDGMVMIESERPEDLHGSHSGKGWIYMVVDDADAHHQRAKAAAPHVLSDPPDYGPAFPGSPPRHPQPTPRTFATLH